MTENATPEQEEATRLALALAHGELSPSAPSAEDEILLRAERTLHEQIIAVAREICRSLTPEEIQRWTDEDCGVIVIGSCIIPVEHVVAVVMEQH